MTGITREKASQVAADFLGGESRYLGTYYKTYAATDAQGREWKFTFDGSILAEKKEHGERVSTDATYKTEMVAPSAPTRTSPPFRNWCGSSVTRGPSPTPPAVSTSMWSRRLSMPGPCATW